MIPMRTALQNSLKTVFGILLLQLSSNALAFTLLPQEQLTPSSTVTSSSTTLTTQVQPVAGAIKAHLFRARRTQHTGRIAQHDNVLAANSYVSSISDLDYPVFAYNDLAVAGGGSGMAASSNRSSLWINSTYSSLKNTFSRTRFDGDVQMVLAGFDYTVSDQYILGVALGHQTSNFNTRFNSGDERTKGFNFSPYFAYLLSDAWSFDLSLGHGKFNTAQSRTMALALLSSVTVESGFSSTRDFVSSDLTYASTMGNWNLTGSFGVFAAKQRQDAYVETTGTAVASSSQSTRQWNLAGEAAYSHQNSESYVGLVYEKLKNPESVTFATGEQPSNDPDSFLLTAGWRYLGKDIVANFVFSSRLGQTNVTDNGFATTIRVDL